MERTTISCLSSFIFMENFFCVNRSYLIIDRKKRIFGNAISIATFSAIITIFVADMLNSEANVNEKMFRGVLAAEFLILSFAARYRKVAFAALNRLDEKCGAENTYLNKLQSTVHKETFVAIASVIIDMVGMYMLGVTTRHMFSYTVIYAVHEAETIFFTLIIEGMNLRLMKLDEVTPSVGSRVYRHVLLSSSQMNVEFTARIFIILAIVLFTSVSYSCAVLLMFSEKAAKVIVYLLWRELKSMYCVWHLCRASAKSDAICQRIAFQLAKKLAFDSAFDKTKNPHAYSIARRWFTTILQHRPSYVRGCVLSLGLSVPLYLVDISINYVLIIVQIYVAYK